MTSKDNESAGLPPVPPSAISHHRTRTERHGLIRAGELRPDEDDVLAGAPWFGESIVRDIGSWCDAWLFKHARRIRNPQAVEAVRVLRESCTAEFLKIAEAALADAGDEDGVFRMRLYRACSDDADARRLIIERIVAEADIVGGTYDDAWRDATALGLTLRSYKSFEDYCGYGVNAMRVDTRRFDDLKNAAQHVLREAEKKEEQRKDQLLADVRGVAADDADFLQAVAEDRAEYWHPRTPELVVVPLLPEASGSAKRDIYKSWKGIDSVPLPIVIRADIAAQRRELVEQWPHAVEVVDTILGDLAALKQVRFRPTLLVGEPGSGKTSLLRAICETVGLPVERFDMSGAADSSAAGTSAQWHSARESVPLQLIKRVKHASVAVIWDEIEKSSTGRHNGSPMEALLPMLDLGQASQIRDPALEVEVDLSMVSHFATANSLDGVPPPLRDRMRILQMPEPSWQHVGVLTRQIIDRVARERGVRPEWFAPLAEDEMELVRQAWPGGSLRQLTRIVTTILDGRDQLMGRA